MRKLLFVLPNSRWFDSISWDLYPYNVCLLAAILEPDYDVDILDFNADNLTLDEAVESIEKEAADYIGISCLAVEYSKHAHALANEIKKIMPEVPVILGGVYCTLMPEHAMENRSFDYCVLGEGEFVLKKLLNGINRNQLPESLDGIAFRIKNQIVIKPQVEFINDLDSLPLPALHKIDFKKYGYVNEKFSISNTRDALPVCKIYTSRGCPAGCNFCAVENIDGAMFRFRSVESILGEIEFMIESYGVKEIVFYDDNLLFNKTRAKELFRQIIKRKYNIKFKPANVAIYSLDEEMLDLMSEAGCTMLVFAIESASERVLSEIMGKPLSIKNVPHIVEYAKELGFRCAALFVIGNPDETWDEIQQTIHFAESLDIYVHFSIATPLPKTRLFKTAKEKNYLTDDFDFAYGAGCSRGWLVTNEFTPFDMEVLRVYEWDRINFGTSSKKARSAAFFDVTVEEAELFSRNARVAIQQRYVHDKKKRLVELDKWTG